jgi:hypothetical protein
MNPVLKEGRSLEGNVTVTLTRRDILLLNLCLQLVERNHAKDGSLRYDIQGLRAKLSDESEESR